MRAAFERFQQDAPFANGGSMRIMAAWCWHGDGELASDLDGAHSLCLPRFAFFHAPVVRPWPSFCFYLEQWKESTEVEMLVQFHSKKPEKGLLILLSDRLLIISLHCVLVSAKGPLACSHAFRLFKPPQLPSQILKVLHCIQYYSYYSYVWVSSLLLHLRCVTFFGTILALSQEDTTSTRIYITLAQSGQAWFSRRLSNAVSGCIWCYAAARKQAETVQSEGNLNWYCRVILYNQVVKELLRE
jgi:hypothetical protein